MCLGLVFLSAVPRPFVKLGSRNSEPLGQLIDSILGPVSVVLPGLLKNVVFMPGQSPPPPDVLVFA